MISYAAKYITWMVALGFAMFAALATVWGIAWQWIIPEPGWLARVFGASTYPARMVTLGMVGACALIFGVSIAPAMIKKTGVRVEEFSSRDPAKSSGGGDASPQISSGEAAAATVTGVELSQEQPPSEEDRPDQVASG